MKLTELQLKSLIANYILEQEDAREEKSDDVDKQEKKSPDDLPEMVKYVKDSGGKEHEIQFKADGDVLTLHINGEHFNPRGVKAAEKLNNGFLTAAAAILKNNEDDIEAVKKSINIIKSIDANMANKSDLSIADVIRKKIADNRPPFSLLDDLLNRNRV